MTQQATRSGLAPKEIRAQLRRILASDEFASSERMQEFLRRSVGEVLAGRADGLKEYSIGVEVFRRPESFDPAIDPIVRVEARRLRSKLERYYASEGRGDPLIIELPKGGYCAAFRKRTSAEPAASAARTRNAIAVLPFQAVGNSPEAQQFSEGLTWELTHRLTRIDGLSVVAPSSVARLPEGFADPASVGTKLQVGTILTGSVRQAGDRIRIVAQLVSTASGVCLWSETYDRQLEDILSIQDDIAQAIVTRLRIEFATDLVPRRRPAAYNAEAYRLYLRGRAVWTTRTEAGIRRGLELFREAAALDPNFALAYAGMADAWTLLADYALEPPTVAMPAAKSAALRAIGIDGSLAEAHASLGLQSACYEWKWEDAELHFRHSIDLNPGYAAAHHWYGGDLLAILGRFDEAMDELELACELDPLSPIIAEGRAHALFLSGKLEQARDSIEKLIREYPDVSKLHSALGRVLIHMGRHAEAIEHLQVVVQLSGRLPRLLGAMGQALALSGKPDEARELLREVEQQSEQRYVPSSCFALIHAGLGEHSRALDWLERGFELKELPMTAIGAHPAYDSLRAEPRFQAILRKMDLPVLR